jgi:hypothetical protein
VIRSPVVVSPLLALALLAGACATPVGVARVDSSVALRPLTASVLSAGEPSLDTRNVLHEEALTARFADEPAAALAALHESVVSGRRGASAVFALAELSFLHAERTGQRPYYFAAAVYAWSFLFPTHPQDRPNPFDRRLRLAADLYNVALAGAFRATDSVHFEPSAGVFALPFGEIDVAFDEAQVRWRGRRFTRFVPVTELEVRGLRVRYRRDGLGTPLAASMRPVDRRTLPFDLVGPGVDVAVTALLTIDRPQEAVPGGRLSGRLTLHVAAEADEVAVDGRPVPLELDPTAVVASTLNDSPIWAHEFRGLFRVLIPNPGARTQLASITPYRPGLIPVVFVHGTASSQGRWAEMYNRLSNSSLIEGRYQYWFFAYDTGAPIAYSAHLLRDALRQAVQELDPEGRDPALRRMVLVGHSQGGLLVKMTVISSGSRLWEGLSSKPFDKLKISDETRDTLRQTLFVEPLPFVTRVVFMATPHHGSFQVRSVLADLFRRLVTLPAGVVRTTAELAKGNPDVFRVAGHTWAATSVDNMNPLSPFIRTLADIPVAPGVHVHSIIAVRGDGLPADGSDGVVAYRSAYIEGGESALVVRSGHSVQDNPAAINEVRRILHEHATAEPEPARAGR